MNADKGRILIAGGGGFIGKVLSRALLARGYQVVALTRGLSAPASGDPDGPRPAFQTWDAATADGWGHLADGALALVNLAGENLVDGRWNAEKKRRILESRVNAGRALSQAVGQAAVKPKVLVQGSAVGFYGSRGEQLLDESSPGGQGFLAEVTGRWEDSTRSVEALGVRRVVARTGLVLGRGGVLWQRLIPAFRWYLGGALGDGGQGFPWIHAQDEAKALVFLLENPQAEGPFNLTAPDMVTNAEFCKALAKALGRPCGLNAPAFALRLLFGDMADEMLLAGCRAFPKRLLELGYVFDYPKLDEALRGLLAKGV